MGLDGGYVERVMRAVRFIEESLHRELDLESICRKAAYSRWHFQRLFCACTGFSVKAYVRRRRLTEACRFLSQTTMPLVDVAFEAGFESQEAFTRAFRAAFGRTPGAVRRGRAMPPSLLLTFPLEEDFLSHIQRGVTLGPRFIALEEKHFLGLSARFIGSLSPDANNQEVIPPLWEELGKRLDGLLAGRLGNAAYGLCLPLEEGRNHEDELEYLAAIEVASGAPVPQGFRQAMAAPGRYAVFTHRGRLSELGHTMRFVFGVWLGQSGHALRKAPDFELYDERFSEDSPDSEMDIYVPIE